jgi:hypothetical protein
MNQRSPLGRATRLLIVLAVLPAASCDTASVWLSGIDRENYSWEPARATTKADAWQTALTACESPGGQAKAAADAPTIMRSEDSAVVEDCMANKGYRKVFATRSGAL